MKNWRSNPVKEEEEKKKKKKKRNPETACSEGRRRSHLVWKEKEKKEDEETHAPKVKSCGWVWQWVPLCSVIYGNAIENRVMKTENS